MFFQELDILYVLEYNYLHKSKNNEVGQNVWLWKLGGVMEEKYIVRIIKNELIHFKNVEYGEIRYMNYGSVQKNAKIEKNDIVGLYGQNGSGKTAMIEALAILKCILAGEEIPYQPYEGLLENEGHSRIITVFYIELGVKRYKAQYEVSLKADHEERKIHLCSEKLVYWQRGATWKSERDLEFINPYYDPGSIINNVAVFFHTAHERELESTGIAQGLQNLAVYCAQKNLSIFFNDLMLGKLSKEKSADDSELCRLSRVILGLSDFGRLYFQVVKVSQLADINRNTILPVSVHTESSNFVMQGCLPLVMDGQGKIPESLYIQLKEAVKAINIALKAIISDLSIEIRPVSEEPDKEGNKNILVEVYSIREGKEFLTRYESEGIKRIISLLNYLISLYNYPEVCLAVDELDSGIFEYLLGEILGVLNEEAKGQLIFTSHNLRAFEKLNIKNIICTTLNPQNRYIRLVGKEKNHNPRDFYIRTITIGGQKEELYDEADLQSIGYAFRSACSNHNKNIKINFSDKFRAKLDGKA